MATLGQKPANTHVSFQKQTITGNGGTSYTLQQSVGSELDIAVFINNTRQEPTTAYTASGTSLVMTGAVNSSDNFYVIFLAKAINTTGLPVSAVNTASINASAVTNDKIANSTIDLTSKVTGVLPAANSQTNAPAFKVTLSSNMTIPDDALTRITWDTEIYDTNNAFASNVFTVPAGQGGTYVFEYHIFGDDIDDTDTWNAYLELDGVKVVGSIAQNTGAQNGMNCLLNNTVTVTVTAGQVVEVVTKQQGTSSSQAIRSTDSFFSGYKLIGI